MKDGTEHEV